jgi:hypothetical protein
MRADCMQPKCLQTAQLNGLASQCTLRRVKFRDSEELQKRVLTSQLNRVMYHCNCHPCHATLALRRVKFRDSEELQTLDANRQSGGERSVSTILYLIALQARGAGCCCACCDLAVCTCSTCSLSGTPCACTVLVGVVDTAPAVTPPTNITGFLPVVPAGRDCDALPSGGRDQPG